ncbi:MAG: hypothetical protein K8R59_11075 [Thermoanaerobaculales bacterium]|nr:hypothetical protein [Thermoanaerobaculales bacterium]
MKWTLRCLLLGFLALGQTPQFALTAESGTIEGMVKTLDGKAITAQDLWAPTTTDNAPSARNVPSLVWTGTEVIVWGGSPVTNTGGRYDPATDSWTTMSTENAPDPRTQHTAVWTGTEMIVWGGFGTSLYKDGGRYDPATNTWADIATPPTAVKSRRRHAAVWTGESMIVWGGYNDSSHYLNTGARYWPGTDTWEEIAIADAPSSRTDHTAVWTGTEMIVWGGWSGFDCLATGGIYDPVADAWRPTETLDAPVGRYSHTAAWTGAQMIVWGGQIDGSIYVSTGGVYILGAPDSWIATSEEGAPTGRALFSGVWTGSELIVWGGWILDSPPTTNTGGVYSPATLEWRETTTTGAPDPRYSHRAVWCGDSMVVWGGLDENNQELNSGGKYVLDWTVIFTDGFESGNLSAWSTTAP